MLDVKQAVSGYTKYVTQVSGKTAAHVRQAFTTSREPAKTTADVLREEMKEICGTDLGTASTVEDYRKAAHEEMLAALCLSGGGIRSAAFSLGVLQALAQKELLAQFNYLSTVSGGGYIGGWLSRWISEIKDYDATTVQTTLGSAQECRQISGLRANSNFLTPKVGLTSADTWTGVLLWVRNVILTWTVFVPALLFAVMVVNLCIASLLWLEGMFIDDAALAVALAVGALLLTVATWQTASNLPSHRETMRTHRSIRWRIIVPLLIWAALVPLLLVAAGWPTWHRNFLGSGYGFLWWLLGASFAAKILGYVVAGVMANPRDYRVYIRNSLTWVLVSLIATAALALALYIIGLLAPYMPSPASLFSLPPAQVDVANVIVVLCILGPLGVTLAHLLLSTLYAGFRVPGFQDDADREWLARLSAVNVFPTLLWGIFAALCLLLPWLVIDGHLFSSLPETLKTAAERVTGVIGAVSGVIAVLGGKSATTKPDVPGLAGGKSATEILVQIAALIFIAFLVAWLAYLERYAVDALIDVAAHPLELGAAAQWLIPRALVFLAIFPVLWLAWYVISGQNMVLLWCGIVLAILSLAKPLSDMITDWVLAERTLAGKLLVAQFFIAAGVFFIVTVSSLKIDINRYSMHGVYRNRLVRAFLGAARRKRNEDDFTRFDPEDNRRMCELRAQAGGKRVLFPVINVTLNLVGGENLAWQERKASSFIITPLHCGSGTLGEMLARGDDPPTWRGAYIDTSHYGGKEPDLRFNGKARERAEGPVGISLGTAMTISGAAASPNMGYHSSPATAFLLTLFNVRLGAWLANPASDVPAIEKQDGPTSALRPLLVEAFGLTNDKSKNIYLSDGGHFDNLGIYEMIRRRCRFILVVDAGADKDFKFEDLGKSVRQASIDLDAQISFKTIGIKPAQQAKEDSPTFAVGTIKYAENPNREGCIVYIKPTYFIDKAPVDVRSYGALHGDFPHESTGDQWFSESQFEGYRRLGAYLTDKLFNECLEDHPSAMPTLPEFFDAAYDKATSANAASAISGPPIP